MKLDVSSITKANGASLDVQFEDVIEDLNNISNDFVFSKVLFNGTLKNNSGILYLDGKINSEYIAKCYRCLKDIKKDIDISIEEEFVNAISNKDSEAYTYAGNFIEIEKVLRDNIILNLPVKHVCVNDCKGLCNKCGENLNDATCKCKKESVNSSMEGLKDFFKD